MTKQRPEGRRAPKSHARDAAPGGSAARDLGAARGSLWIALASLAVARAALSFVPSTWAWAFGLQRFLPAGPAWSLWALAALPLVPAFSRLLAPALQGAGDAIGESPWLALPASAMSAALLVWLVPDTTWFVGDFVMRMGAAMGNIPTDFLFPQALPLDLLLHHDLPAAIHAPDPTLVERVLGAAEAALAAMLSLAFTRALRLRGAAASAAAAVVFLGGYLGLFTGYGKAFREMCVLTIAVAVFGLRFALEGKSLLLLGATVTLGLALHRSALAFVPAMVTAWALGLRHLARSAAWRRPAAIAGLALPLVALGGVLPRLISTFVTVDLPTHLASADVRASGGVIRSIFAGTRAADLVNLVLMLSPLAVSLPVLGPLLGQRLSRGTGAVLLALLVPFLGALLLVHPRQGMFRDWDDFAACGVALSLVTAWLVGEALRDPRQAPALGPIASGSPAVLAVVVVLGVASPAFQWLLHNHEVDRGLARVEAFLSEPPAREPGERALAYHYLGTRYTALRRLDSAADAYAHAAELAPSPRLLYDWAIAEADRGRLEKSREVLLRLVGKAAPMAQAWLALAQVSLQLGDTTGARAAAESTLALAPGQGEAQRLLEGISRR